MNRKSSAQVHELPLGIWWIDNSLKSTFSIFLTTHECREGAKSVSWTWLSPLRGYNSLTFAFLDKFTHMYTYCVHT